MDLRQERNIFKPEGTVQTQSGCAVLTGRQGIAALVAQGGAAPLFGAQRRETGRTFKCPTRSASQSAHTLDREYRSAP